MKILALILILDFISLKILISNESIHSGVQVRGGSFFDSVPSEKKVGWEGVCHEKDEDY